MSIQEWTVTEPYLAMSCKLGEGPYYVPERHELRFMDINDNKLFVIDLAKGPSSVKTIETTKPIGVTADIEGEDSSEVILAGYKDGVVKFNLKTATSEYLAKYWSGPNALEQTRLMRSNEGSVDSQGRFWVSAFVDPEIQEPEEEGVLYRLDAGNQLTQVLDKVIIPNGMSWTADDKTLYFTDSPRQDIYAFDYDSSSGAVSNRRLFHHISTPGSYPDGHAMDIDGNLWVACYGGSSVIRVSPAGTVTGVIHLPTRNITCPVFVGTTLFITTARDEQPDQHPRSAQFAGNLFRVDVGVAGAAKYKVRLG